jgi:ribosome maturation factor RimP
MEESSYLILAKLIDEILEELNYETFTVTGVTNYVDSRLILMITRLLEDNKKLTINQLESLEQVLNLFLKDLKETGYYFIPQSGTYGLKYKPEFLLDTFQTYKNFCLEVSF